MLNFPAQIVAYLVVVLRLHCNLASTLLYFASMCVDSVLVHARFINDPFSAASFYVYFLDRYLSIGYIMRLHLQCTSEACMLDALMEPQPPYLCKLHRNHMYKFKFCMAGNEICYQT